MVVPSSITQLEAFEAGKSQPGLGIELGKEA